MTGLLLSLVLLSQGRADELQAEAPFERLRHDPVQLSQFLSEFPTGGDLHASPIGSVYAESAIRWATEDGKCVDRATH
ncbi:hypothetical protein LXT13_06305 [Pelomonas sp. P8]|uniref:Uncharacterized protein n=2 Tax=Pelomonas cellulosilytica TaxID=2906762 RepID=A0ABS8XQX2_9BURK|nr:hypothetical protein [Pelomonas sp. P8]